MVIKVSSCPDKAWFLWDHPKVHCQGEEFIGPGHFILHADIKKDEQRILYNPHSRWVSCNNIQTVHRVRAGAANNGYLARVTAFFSGEN